jgi:hypothetical protein
MHRLLRGIQARKVAPQAQLQCLGLTVSAPPTQAEVRAIAGQPDEVITTLQGHVTGPKK